MIDNKRRDMIVETYLRYSPMVRRTHGLTTRIPAYVPLSVLDFDYTNPYMPPETAPQPELLPFLYETRINITPEGRKHEWRISCEDIIVDIGTIKHDPYLSTSLNALGLVGTIVALQKYGAQSYQRYETHMRLRSFGHEQSAVHEQRNAEWAYRNARILMGIE